MNNFCNKKFTVWESMGIKDNMTGPLYINRKDLIDDNNCDQVCEKTKQEVCNILLALDEIILERKNKS